MPLRRCGARRIHREEMNMKISLIRTVALFLAFSGAAGQAAAQAWPARQPRIVVSVVPGGNLDIIARAVAAGISDGLGRRVLVENRPGANSVIGIDHVAKSPADGYTLLMISPSFTYAPYMNKSLPYDTLRDFTGVSMAAWIPQMLLVNPGVAARNVKELITYAKANPGKLDYGSSSLGSGSHIGMEMFKRAAGVAIVRIGYNGDAQALADLVGGHVNVKFDNFSTSIPLVKGGKVRALGVSSPQRFSLLPDIPAIAETLPGFEASIFNGVVAPAGVPKDILARLQGEIAKWAATPEARKHFADQGIELQASTSPEQFTSFLNAEVARSAKVIKEAGIVPE
jgi:tripartite-type tricarboxylate transporter receptor subunit TctC